jgi:hypothetical protein
MTNKKANFFGVLLSVLLLTSIIALLYSQPQITGFVVKEQSLGKEIIDVTSCYGANCGQKCADSSFFGECSFLNGKFCQDGILIPYCELCGCREGFVCSDSKCVRE